MSTKLKTTLWRGVTVDVRTAAQLDEVDKLVGEKIPVHLAQGCYHKGVSASAGTHDRGGCVDISVHNPRTLKSEEIEAIVKACREVGLWAWYRAQPEWHDVTHIHAVSVGCKDLAPLAATQITDARHGINGLVNRMKDRHAYMHLPVISWEDYLAKKKAAAPKVSTAAKAKVATAVVVAAASGATGAHVAAPAPVKATTSVVVPAKAAPAKAATVKLTKLSSSVKPWAHAAQVKELQKALHKAGYLSLTSYTDYYGRATQKAVGRFLAAHPTYASHKGDVAIGHNGWVALQKLAAKKG